MMIILLIFLSINDFILQSKVKVISHVDIGIRVDSRHPVVFIPASFCSELEVLVNETAGMASMKS